MSNSISNNISREKTRHLLAAIGTRSAEEQQMDVCEHDWHQPHYFNSGQLSRLDNFTKKIATTVAETLAQFYHSGFNVTTTSIMQHFAGDFFDHVLNSGQNDYYLAFGSNQEHLCGLIKIPQQTAATWTKQLLGDDETEKDSRDSASQPDQGKSGKALSQLEESLLSDIVSAIVKSLSSVHPSWAGDNLHPVSGLAKGQLPIKLSDTGGGEAGALQSTQEICMIIFSIEKANPASNKPTPASAGASLSPQRRGVGEACLLIPCSRLAPIVGKITDADSKLSSEDTSKAIFEHLQQMPVSVAAQLAVTALTFEQIISLCPNDILLLDKVINEPIELIVEGRTAFRGLPAQSDGQHAIVITELYDNATQNVNPKL